VFAWEDKANFRLSELSSAISPKLGIFTIVACMKGRRQHAERTHP